jgi:hypothetical protein
MSINTYGQYVKLSDSLERELTREALSCGEPVSIADLAKSIAKGVKIAARALARVLSDATRPLGNVRAHDSHLSSARW